MAKRFEQNSVAQRKHPVSASSYLLRLLLLRRAQGQPSPVISFIPASCLGRNIHEERLKLCPDVTCGHPYVTGCCAGEGNNQEMDHAISGCCVSFWGCFLWILSV